MKRWNALLFVLLMAACGGGGSSSTAVDNGATQISAGEVTSPSAATNPTSNSASTAIASGGSGASSTSGAASAPTGSGTAIPPSVTSGGSVSAPVSAAVKPEYFHILSSGQSLATGEAARPSISTVQPYRNLMLSPDIRGASGPLQPLVEGDASIYSPESPSSGLANSLRAWDNKERAVIVGLHGQGGAPLATQIPPPVATSNSPT